MEDAILAVVESSGVPRPRGATTTGGSAAGGGFVDPVAQVRQRLRGGPLCLRPGFSTRWHVAMLAGAALSGLALSAILVGSVSFGFEVLATDI